MTATPTLDFRPGKVDMAGTAGDTLDTTVTVGDITQMPNPVFTAQVRDMNGENAEDFAITPTADGAVVSLTTEQTRRLFDLGPLKQIVKSQGRVRSVWTGVYDIQVAHDPAVVRTLVSGALTLEGDVTRDE